MMGARMRENERMANQVCEREQERNERFRRMRYVHRVPREVKSSGAMKPVHELLTLLPGGLTAEQP